MRTLTQVLVKVFPYFKEDSIGVKQAERAINRWLDEKKRQRIVETKSLCGCPRCEYHLSDYKLKYGK